MASSQIIDREIELKFGANIVRRMRNNSGGTVSSGECVILDTTVSAGDAFTTTTAQDNAKVLGCAGETIGNGDYGKIIEEGYVTNLSVDGTGTSIAAGDNLSSYTSAKVAGKATAGKAGVFAIALEAATTATTIKARIIPAGRQDASGTVSYGTVGQMAADGLTATNAAGTTAAVARIDHTHAYTNDPPALVFSTSNATGTVGKPLAVDATIAIFDATTPGAIQPDDSAATGSAAFAARRDHTHGNTSAAPADGSGLSSANAKGTATSLSRSDHTHKAIALNAVPVILGTTDAAGTAGRLIYQTAETNDCVKLAVDETSRRLMVCDYGDQGTDSTLAAATNPEITLMTADYTEYAKMHTTTTGFEIDVSTGNTFRHLVNGSLVMDIDNLGNVRAGAGLVGAPSHSFSADATTGFYRIGASNVGLALGGTKNWDFAATATSFTGANGTSNTALTVENTSNAAAASHSYLDVRVGGTTSTGDPQIRLTIPGGTSWYLGADNDTSDLFSIGVGAVVGTTPVLRFDGATTSASGIIMTIPSWAFTISDGATSYLRAVSAANQTATLAGTTTITTLQEIWRIPGWTYAQSGGAVTLQAASTMSLTAPTCTTSVTLSAGYAAYIGDPAAATGTYTAQYGVYVAALTRATTNYAFWNNGAAANVVLQGSGALATTATNGFTYLPSCAGAPSGVPTAVTGAIPLIYDSVNNKIYVYNAAWKATAALA